MECCEGRTNSSLRDPLRRNEDEAGERRCDKRQSQSDTGIKEEKRKREEKTTRGDNKANLSSGEGVKVKGLALREQRETGKESVGAPDEERLEGLQHTTAQQTPRLGVRNSRPYTAIHVVQGKELKYWIMIQ